MRAVSSSALMYADDTSLTLFAYDPATLEEKLNKDLDEVQKWLKSNKLTLNVKKTKYMIIGSHYRLRHYKFSAGFGEAPGNEYVLRPLYLQIPF